MLIGIDVGGTYTDGVLVTDDGCVLAAEKYPTSVSGLLESLIGCLDQLLPEVSPKDIRRVTISTTLLTNAVLQEEIAKTALLLMPGPGLSPETLALGTKPFILRGAINFRGVETEPLNMAEVKDLRRELVSEGYCAAAVAGKFSQRNNSHELAVESCLWQTREGFHAELSHRLNGGLNFPRRAVTAYLTAAVRGLFSDFVLKLRHALESRGIKSELCILKADGGTLPLEAALQKPLETVYSGPAASLLGVVAMSEPGETAVVLDIGGTTTDLGLVLGGNPLLSSRGAEIGPFKTQVRSFGVSSVKLGGDTPLETVNGKLEYGPKRLGPGFCLGGPVPTLTDALHCLELSKHGSKELAQQALGNLAAELGISVAEVARLAVDKAVGIISAAIKDTIAQWENEPAYRVWEVLNPHRLNKFKLIGVGGASPGITPVLAGRLNCSYQIPCYAGVANALGAALAKSTFILNLRADTAAGTYTLAGTQKPWKPCANELEQARTLLEEAFLRQCRDWGLGYIPSEFTREEIFNVVRGFDRDGRIIEFAMEVKAGVLTRVRGGRDFV